MDPIGNITQTPIRQIWESLPHSWKSGCSLGRRMTEAEKSLVGLHVIRWRPGSPRKCLVSCDDGLHGRGSVSPWNNALT